MSFNIGNKKYMIVIILVILILVLSSTAYYIDNWANFSPMFDNYPSPGPIDIGLEKFSLCINSLNVCFPMSRYDNIGMAVKGIGSENTFKNPNDANTINKNSKNCLWYMKISQTFFIIAIVLYLYDPIKYKIYITALFILAGIFSLLVVICANKIANSLHGSLDSSSKTPNPKLQVSSYLLIISGILSIGIGAIININ